MAAVIIRTVIILAVACHMVLARARSITERNGGINTSARNASNASNSSTTTLASVVADQLISWKEFKRSLTLNNYPKPNKQQYSTVLKLAKQFDITTKQELAMFLAQVYWESAGLQVTILPFENIIFSIFPSLIFSNSTPKKLPVPQANVPPITGRAERWRASTTSVVATFNSPGWRTMRTVPWTCTMTCDWLTTPRWSQIPQKVPGDVPSGTGKSMFTT